jgi:myosin-1
MNLFVIEFQTLRNNNSSRFGKYLSVQFTCPAGLPFRGNIDTFLLEKSRVVYQSKGERNYHSFYQLLAGGGDQLRNYGLIQNPSNYFYLSQSQCYTIDEVDDTTDFKELCNAMETCGIGETERKDIFTLVGVVLHLGNIKFTEDKHSKASPSDPATVATAAKYMGINAELLERVLAYRKIKSVREEIDATNNEMQANSVRDAIAKAIYSRLFDHIVNSINQSIYADDSVADEQMVYACSVLDIYGFEVFQTNGFEQFAIVKSSIDHFLSAVHN